MKLEFPKIKVETSRTFENENFGLGDIRVIMELLSSKIYSRPKYIIVQEVASNARDANREAGKEDVPISIKLPNSIDDNLIITDSGFGISPQRMSEVFLKYGNSTKRDGNEMTGGFGIGAKTPFTYTDTFTIVTTTLDADGKKYKRTYIAHKADSGFAKMSLICSEQTDGDTGTSISFAVDKKDFKSFEYAARQVCRFWNPRPVVTGIINWTWPEETVLHSGSGWELVDKGDPIVLVDRIPYTLRLDAIFTDRYTKEYQTLDSASIRMYFNTGEIDISATREDLDYKNKTVDIIKQRVKECLGAIEKTVSKIVEGAPNLWEASILWQKNSSAYKDLLVEPKWQGKKLFGKRISLPGPIHNGDISADTGGRSYVYPGEHIKVYTLQQDYDGKIETLRSARYNRWRDNSPRAGTILVSKDCLVVEDDAPEVRFSRLRIRTLFETHPNVSLIAVVKINDDIGREIVEKKWNWAEIPKVMLAGVAKAKREATSSTGKKRTINAVKEIKDSARSVVWESALGRSPEDDQGGTYVIVKNGKAILPSGLVITKSEIRKLSKALDEPVYGILYKYRKKISAEWSELSELVNKKVEELSKKSSVVSYLKLGDTRASTVIGRHLSKKLRARISEIKDVEVRNFLNDCVLAEKGYNDYVKYTRLLQGLGRSIPTSNKELSNRWDSLQKNYPVLSKWSEMHGYWSRDPRLKQIVSELIFYLNAKYDASMSQQGVNNANP